MPTITIGQHYMYDNIVLQAILSNKNKPIFKEVLVFSPPRRRWLAGSLLTFKISFFKNELSYMTELTQDELNKLQSNE